MAKQKPEIRRELKELFLLFEISQILDGSLDLGDVVNPVLKADWINRERILWLFICFRNLHCTTPFCLRNDFNFC